MANSPKWVKTWIGDLAQLTDRFRNEDGLVDYTELGKEEYRYRMALITQDFKKSARAEDAWKQASENHSTAVANGKKGGRPKKSTSSSGKSASIPTTSDNSSQIGGSGEIQKALTVAENSQQGFRNGEPLSAFGPINNVYLTAGEVAEFTKRFGDAQYMIERLSTYMASTKKRYLNHFAKIWEWAMQDVANNINPANGKKLDQYTRIVLGAAADGVDLKNPPKAEPKKKEPRPYEGPIGFEEFG